jgi:nucleoside-triphosphatase
VLIEFSVRILGKNYLGFIVGSILAVSWSFGQKIINYLIFYGFNIVEVYKSLMKFAEKQLNLQFDTLWIPILLLLSVYVFIGLVSAIIGIKTGEKFISQPLEYKPQQYNNQQFLHSSNSKNDFNYSILWLLADFVLIVTSIILISLTDWKIWSISVFVIVVIWILRYKRALRQLLKPKFWFFFVAITMLTAFVFTKLQSKPILDAILIGLEMNFRATVLILGFSVLGTELYNPKIRHFFNKTRFKQLPLALELAAESLPMVIANIPDFKTIIKNPVSVVSQLIAYSEHRFLELKKEQNFHQKIFLVTGKIDSGKTTFVKNLIENLKFENIKTRGIYSEKIFENNERIGYNIVDVKTFKSEKFLRAGSTENLEMIGIFSIFPQGLEFGIKHIKPGNNTDFELVIIDEIGKLEISGKGWAQKIEELLMLQKNHILLVIREDVVDKAIEKWNLNNISMIKIEEVEIMNAMEQIISEIKS